ncbi:MAG: enoyl-CoA hydratase/isomerase family protein [Parcubacteria group bacterium]
MPYAHLELRQDGDALWVTLNRPDSLNALNRQLVDELRGFFQELYWRRDVRVVALAGAGRAFCAGLDLKEHGASPRESTVEQSLDSQRGIAEIVVAMRRCPQPIVGLINGAASGGGFAIALACDVRVATPDVRMNAAFIRIGLSACDIGVSYFLPRTVGSSVAAEYMLTGRFIDAERARELGLVSQVVPREQLEEVGRRFVNDMLHATPLGLRLTKEALNHAIDAGSLEAVIAMEDRNQVLTSRDANFQEGIRAFMEKRSPVYRRG